jgi:hypothetical protein
MADKERQVSERSLENLKLGAESRRQGKLRHNFTILPETVQWLKGTGNASDAIDGLVEAARTGNLNSKNTHDWKEAQNTESNDVYNQRILELNQSLEETYLELATVLSRLQESLDKQQLLTNQLNYCQQDRAKITELLKPALKFPGNNAAPIKAQIRAVIALLDDAQNLELGSLNKPT